MQPEATVSLSELIGTVRRRAVVIAGCGILFAVASGLWSTRRARSYQARAQVLLTQAASPVLGEAGEDAEIPSVDTQIALLGSRQAAVEIAQLAGEESKLAPEDVHGALRIEELEKTSLLEVSALSPDPRKAAVIANAAADFFVAQNESFYQGRTRASLAFVEERLPSYEQRLAAAERTLRLFREASGTAQSPGGGERLAQALGTFETAAAETAVDLQEARHRATELQSELSRENSALMDPETLRDNSLIEGLRQQLVDAESRYAVAKRKYTDKFPNILPDLEAEISDLQTRLKVELRKVADGESGDLATQQRLVQQVIDARSRALALETRQIALRQVVAQYRRQLQHLPSQEQELNRLRREVSAAEDLYTALIASRDRLRLTIQQERGAAQVIERASPPKAPAGSAASSTIALALALGLVVGLVAAFLLEAADRAGGPGPPMRVEQAAPEVADPAETNPPPDDEESDLTGQELRAAEAPTKNPKKLIGWVAVGLAASVVVVLLAGKLPKPASAPAKAKDAAPKEDAKSPAETVSAQAEASSQDEDPSEVDLSPSLGDLVAQDGGGAVTNPKPPSRLAARPTRSRWPELDFTRVDSLPAWPSQPLVAPPPPESFVAHELPPVEAGTPEPSPEALAPGTEQEQPDARTTEAKTPADTPLTDTPELDAPGTTAEVPAGESHEGGPDSEVPSPSADTPESEAPPTVAPPVSRPTGPRRRYVVWVGSYRDRQAAEESASTLGGEGWAVKVTPQRADDEATYRVEVGSYASRQDAESALADLRDEGHQGEVVYKFRF